MNPISFKGCNVVYAKDQPEYLPLPVRRFEDGEIITCWKLSIRERIKVLFTSKIWLSVLTFNHPLQPLLPSVDKPDTATKVNQEG
jgi:hypothetical protein